jgi:drug/metabolite transporter (DMT)-like permease
MVGAGSAVAAALGASVFLGTGTALQHRSAREAPGAHFLRPSLLAHLLTRRLWVAGSLAAAVGLGLHVLALDLGELALVQPLLVTSLLFALPVSAIVRRRTLGWTEGRWALVTAAGLALFLIVASPGPARHPVDVDATGVVLVPVLAVVGCAPLLSLRGSPRWRAVVLGLAAGACFGVLAAIVKVTLHVLGNGLGDLLTSWPLFALVAVGLLGLLLNMSAFQAGPLAASLAAVTIANPIVSIALGVTGFGEKLAAGSIAHVLEAVGLLVMSVGVLRTARVATT